jgi:predicted nucleic acid-binding protein
MIIADEAVIDSSVIIAFVTPEDQTEWTRQKLSRYSYFHILDLNYYEVANVLRYKISDNYPLKTAQLAWSDSVEFMNQQAFHSFSEVINEAFNMAKNLNFSVYDAAFVLLADKLDTKLLTLDKKLATKLEETKYHRFVVCPEK